MNDPQAMGKDALRAEVIRLRGTLHVLHDHIHQSRVNDAHEALHCAIDGGKPDAGNVTLDDAARVHAFIAAFNVLAEAHGFPACCIVPIPSKTVPGAHSMQIGGCVETIQAVRRMMGMGPTEAAT